jgi:hypothetical protein
MDIPLPPIDQQKRIAAILDKAEELRRLRRQSIEHLDVLSRSIFIEMFGDPVTNSNKMPTYKLVDFVDEFRYGTSNKSNEYGKPALRIPNVIGGAIDLSSLKLVPVNSDEFERIKPLLWLNKKQRQTNRYQEYRYEKVSVAGDPQRKELTVKQVSENEKMCVAGYPPRSEDAIQDIFHKVAQSKKSGCAKSRLPRRFSDPNRYWAGDPPNAEVPAPFCQASPTACVWVKTAHQARLGPT